MIQWHARFAILRMLTKAGIAALTTYFCGLALVWWIAEDFRQVLPKETAVLAQAWAVVFYTEDETMRHARVSKAVERFRSGDLKGIYMVGGFRPRTRTTGSALMQLEATAMGVPAMYVAHDDTSNDSWSNVENALRFLGKQSTCRLEMVSDHLHLARIAWIVRRQTTTCEVRFLPTVASWNLVTYWQRLNHEIFGWMFLLLPRPVAGAVLRVMRSELPTGSTASKSVQESGSL